MGTRYPKVEAFLRESSLKECFTQVNLRLYSFGGESEALLREAKVEDEKMVQKVRSRNQCE